MQGVVYIMTNKINGMIYIGRTLNFKSRIKRHVYASQHANSKNWNQPIVSAIREFGIDNFECKILEVIEADNRQDLDVLLDQKEIFYISQYDAIHKGYNLTKGGKGALGYTCDSTRQALSKAHKGKIISEEQKEIVRKNTLKMWQNENFREYMSKRMSGKNNPMYNVRLTGERNHNFGKPMSESSKKKLSESKKGKKGHPMSEELKAKLTQCAKLPKTEEHRRKISETLTGRICPNRRKSVVQYSKDGKFIKKWESISDAENALNIVHISECVRRKRNFAGGFIWRWENDTNNVISQPKNKKPVIQMTLDGVEINEFNSIREASKKLGINYSSISAVLNGLQKKAGNYRFRYSQPDN